MSVGVDAQSLPERLAGLLAARGASVMFGLPGGGPNLDVIGAAVRRGLRFVLAHDETAASIMAATHGLLTGSPTAVVVTRGPGVASAANGIAQAQLDRYPLVAITDTVPAHQRARVSHQRLDQQALLGPVTKLSAVVSDSSSDDALAYHLDLAVRWPRGAVHLEHDAGARPSTIPPAPANQELPGGVDGDLLATARSLLASARRPLVLVGMEAATLGAPVTRLLENLGLPVLTTYQAVGLVPSEGRLNAGLFTNGSLEQPVLDAADLVLAVGLDTVEPIPARWENDVPVIRVSSVPPLDGYLPVTVDLVGDVASTLAALDAPTTGWAADAASRFREEARAVIRGCETSDADRLGPVALVDTVADALPPDATVTVDAGAHFLAAMPLLPVSAPFGLLISNGLATMGFAVPAAIGAAIARPGRPVVALVGDGGLAMTLAELETIARLRLPISVVVFNDAALSLIEIKQGPTHGGSDAVRYLPTNFAAIAAASGLGARVVATAEELHAELRGGWDRPRLIDARIDPASYPALIAATRG